MRREVNGYMITSTTSSLGSTTSVTTTPAGSSTTTTISTLTTTTSPTATTTEPPQPTWHTVVPSTGVSMFSGIIVAGLSCPTISLCVAVGRPNLDLSTGNSEIFVSNNFGSSWSATQYDNQILTSVSCLSATTCIVVGNPYSKGVEYRTTDSGKTWQNLTLPSLFPDTVKIYCIYGSQTCYETAQANSEPANYNNFVGKSTDAGLSWEMTYQPAAHDNLTASDLSCLNVDDCMIVGSTATPTGIPGPGPGAPVNINNYEVYTTNGGVTWQSVQNMSNYGAASAVGCTSSGNRCWVTIEYPQYSNHPSSGVPASPQVEQVQFSASNALQSDMPVVSNADTSSGSQEDFYACTTTECLFPTHTSIDAVSATSQSSSSSITTNNLMSENSEIGACVENGPQCLILGATTNGTPQSVEESFS